jgi:hypothetical protein
VSPKSTFHQSPRLLDLVLLLFRISIYETHILLLHHPVYTLVLHHQRFTSPSFYTRRHHRIPCYRNSYLTFSHVPRCCIDLVTIQLQVTSREYPLSSPLPDRRFILCDNHLYTHGNIHIYMSTHTTYPSIAHLWINSHHSKMSSYPLGLVPAFPSFPYLTDIILYIRSRIKLPVLNADFVFCLLITYYHTSTSLSLDTLPSSLRPSSPSLTMYTV